MKNTECILVEFLNSGKEVVSVGFFSWIIGDEIKKFSDLNNDVKGKEMTIMWPVDKISKKEVVIKPAKDMFKVLLNVKMENFLVKLLDYGSKK